MKAMKIDIDNGKINEVLKDDTFIKAMKSANERGYVSCSEIQREFLVSYPKALSYVEVMSLFKGFEYSKGTYRFKVNFSDQTMEKVRNKEIEVGDDFKRLSYLDD